MDDHQSGRAAERADVLAYLARQAGNCATVMEAKNPEFADEARLLRRKIEVLADEIAGGLHESEAAVQAVLTSGDAASKEPA